MSTATYEKLRVIHMQDDSNKRILDAATYLFALQSYKNTSTKSIANHAGVSEALLFKQFKNKQNLLKCVVTDIINIKLPLIMNMYLDELISSTHPKTIADIKSLLFEKVTQINNNVGYFKILIFELSELDEETLLHMKDLLNSIIDRVCLMIDHLKAKEFIKNTLDSRLIFRSFIGMSNFMLIDMNFLSEDIDFEKEFSQIFELFMRGIINE
ncbi:MULTISPECIES: TetR/AcrR family transcriptional regulator [unclassified Fusibacter]|uniref:TetR/AcrR family transcriptional regulator n=1 Tax=unclassified Fusibacter TaxID=2624464 RepID=UPI0013E91378|nr:MULTISPECIES: TetR/AcrR family transcriptional regulator [unclassified Fusibacter]MCK8059092.1 TetR/AcrR family transcriptional regulator [Fusibacter sp. A2]NPE22501.1 TetR/AcrR family transcriptional regulator [Fusibacter sp. A1]